MKQTPSAKRAFVKAVNIILTVVSVLLLPIVEFALMLTAGMYEDGARTGLLLLMLLPPLVLFLIWLPKKARYMLSLGGIALLIVAGAATAIGIYAYNESLIIDTTPSINVREYLPFDEDSRIVKLRSEQVSFVEDPPVIDGAAALFPVYSAFVNATYPVDTTLGRGVFQYNNTPQGYRALAEKKTDLFIGVYPSEEQIAYAQENGTHFVYTPIGYDAFVFFVHKDNPIDSLTIEQIRAIYAGEITNWCDVGGKDEPIVAYQRNEGSGSQSMLFRFMGDKEPMPPSMETTSVFMGGIIEEVANYKSVTASIGFSFRFYVEGIIQHPDIKMIAIDGVYPTADNVRNERYPICTPFYAVTYEENTNPNTRILIDWILSEEGQYIIEESGYIGVGRREDDAS